MFWGVFAGVLILAVVWGLVRAIASYRGDLCLVDMRNQGMGVAQIAEALGTTDDDVRTALRRISDSVGPNPP